MSVRTELEDLVKWISELSAKGKPTQPPQPLPREDWHAVDSDLGRAAETFAEAHLALRAAAAAEVGEAKDSRFLAELARDLEHEAQGLALRAHLLSRRAPPKPKTEAGEPKTPAPATHAAAAEEKAKVEPPGAAEKHKETAEEHKPRPASTKSPAELIDDAARTLATAYNKLGAVEHLDAVSKAFEEELDVLAEMTLTLRQKCDRPDDAPMHAEVGR